MTAPTASLSSSKLNVQANETFRMTLVGGGSDARSLVFTGTVTETTTGDSAEATMSINVMDPQTKTLHVDQPQGVTMTLVSPGVWDVVVAP